MIVSFEKYDEMQAHFPYVFNVPYDSKDEAIAWCKTNHGTDAEIIGTIAIRKIAAPVGKFFETKGKWSWCCYDGADGGYYLRIYFKDEAAAVECKLRFG